MSKKLLSLLERWLTLKIGVEIRCCLTFFLMLFFCCVYRLLTGTLEVCILHMAEMMLLAYLIGWVQALLGTDMTETDQLRPKEWAVLTLCAAASALACHLFGWLDGNALAAALYLLYMIGCELSTFLICKIKRAIDAKLLNAALHDFQQRSGNGREQ